MMTTHYERVVELLPPAHSVGKMVEDYAYLLGLDATFLIIGAVVFSSADFRLSTRRGLRADRE
jgi:hypothetical protein